MTKIPASLARLIRFGLVGVVVFGVSLGLTALLHELLGMSEELAFGITLVVVLLGGFAANRYVVFDASGGDARRQGAHYAAAALSFRGLQYLSFLALHTWLGVPYVPAIIVVLGFWFLIKYAYYGKRVFKMGRPDPATGRQ